MMKCSKLGLLELVRVDRVLERARALEEGLYIHTFGDQMDVEQVQAGHLADGEGDLRVMTGESLRRPPWTPSPRGRAVLERAL